MSYIAEAKDITVFGQTFQSFLDEEGNVVFSQHSTAIGLDLPETSLFRLRRSKELKSILGKGFESSTLRTNLSNRAISVVTMSELTELVSVLASKGHDRAVAMHQAGFAMTLQMSLDEAYGIERNRKEYVDGANQAAKWIEERRKELRRVSNSITNPTIACNLYQFNNELVYGLGQNRDTYDEEDKGHKHFVVTNLESIQAGLKMAGLSFEEIKERSYDLYARLSK